MFKEGKVFRVKEDLKDSKELKVSKDNKVFRVFLIKDSKEFKVH